MTEPTLDLTYLLDTCYLHGCQLLQNSHTALRRSDQAAFETALSQSAAVGQSTLQDLFKRYLNTSCRERLSPEDTARLDGAALFPDLLDMMTRYAEPPLDPGLQEQISQDQAIYSSSAVGSEKPAPLALLQAYERLGALLQTYLPLDARQRDQVEAAVRALSLTTLEVFHAVIQNSDPQEREQLFSQFAAWLKTHENEVPTWLRYLSILNEYGTNQQKQAALLELENWLERNPDDGTLRARLLTLLRGTGSFSQVKEWILSTRGWLRDHAENAPVRTAYLRLLERGGDSQQCIEAIDETLQCLKTAGPDLQLLQAILSFVRRKGTPEQVRELFDTTEGLLEQQPSNENLRAAYLRAVAESDDVPRKMRALETTSRFLEQRADMSTWEMYLSLVNNVGTKELLHGEMARAAKWMQGKPRSGNLRVMIIRLVNEHGTRQETLDTIDETYTWLEQNPDDVNVRSAYLSLVTRYGTPQQVAAALEMTVNWLIEHPSRNDILSRYQILVSKRHVESEYERAVGLSDIWLADHPGQDSRYGHILAGKASILYRMARYHESVPLFRKALFLEFRQYYAQILYGWALYYSGEKEKGLAQLKSLLRYRGEYPLEKLFCEIGRMYYLEGNYRQAMAFLDRAIETSDSFYTGYTELGRTLLADGHPKSALRYLISARARLPERVDDETRQEINRLIDEAAEKALPYQH